MGSLITSNALPLSSFIPAASLQHRSQSRGDCWQCPGHRVKTGGSDLLWGWGRCWGDAWAPTEARWNATESWLGESLLLGFSAVSPSWTLMLLFDLWLPVSQNFTVDCTCVVIIVVHLVVSDSLQPHGLQHARLPCPSLSPGVCSNSCPWSQWCHPTISSSVIRFSSCPQSFPAWGSFHNACPLMLFFLQLNLVCYASFANSASLSIWNLFSSDFQSFPDTLFRGILKIQIGRFCSSTQSDTVLNMFNHLYFWNENYMRP